nr:MAG TPA: hypothetical protein [Caudoviricetes sp.]
MPLLVWRREASFSPPRRLLHDLRKDQKQQPHDEVRQHPDQDCEPVDLSGGLLRPLVFAHFFTSSVIIIIYRKRVNVKSFP